MALAEWKEEFFDGGDKMTPRWKSARLPQNPERRSAAQGLEFLLFFMDLSRWGSAIIMHLF